MIAIEVGIAKRMYEVARFQVTYLCHHHRKQSIGCNIKRHTKEDIRATLVQLTAQLAIGYIKLEQCMAGAKCHPWQVANIPCRDDEPTGIRIPLYLFYHILYLVVCSAVRPRPATPLVAVYRPKVA